MGALEPVLPVEGFVLAGGQSSRMGADKALANFHGRPLVEHALGLFRAASIPARIAGARSDLAAFARVVPDIYPEAGPLAGVHAALSASRAALCLFLPVDMPLVPAHFLVALVAKANATGAGATWCRVGSQDKPFPVVLDTRLLPVLTQRIAHGDCGCLSAWKQAPAAVGLTSECFDLDYAQPAGTVLRPSGLEPAAWFLSTNTREELAQASALFDGPQPGGAAFA